MMQTYIETIVIRKDGAEVHTRVKVPDHRVFYHLRKVMLDAFFEDKARIDTLSMRDCNYSVRAPVFINDFGEEVRIFYANYTANVKEGVFVL